MQTTPYLKIHQTRSSEPTTYENLLGDALERAFAAGIHDLDGVAAHVESAGVPAPDGRTWTVDFLQDELRRLGA